MNEKEFVLKDTCYSEEEITQAVDTLIDVFSAKIAFLERYEPYATNTKDRWEKAMMTLSDCEDLDEEEYNE